MNPFKYDWSGWNIIAIFVVSASLANVRIVVGEEEKSMTNEFSLSRSLQNNVTSIVEEIFNDLNLPFNESIITDVCDLSQINCTEGIMKQFIIPFDTAIGTIPTKIGLLSTLEEFSIGSLKLTGTIPTEVGDLKSLTNLQIYNSYITGTLPTEIASLQNLTNLRLGSNQLLQTIPKEMGNLTNLIDLRLSNNHFSRTIPSELCQLDNLRILDLSINKLTGTLPTEIGSMVNITKLDVSYNSLTGTVPLEIVNANKLKVLDISETKFVGDISHFCGANITVFYDKNELDASCERSSFSVLKIICNAIESIIKPIETLLDLF